MDIDLLSDHQMCGNINTVYYAHVTGLGNGYIKLDNEENYGYPRFTPFEVGAYRVSEILGFHNVPNTVALEHPTFGPCVFSAEVAGEPLALRADWGCGWFAMPYTLGDMQKMACLDIIIGNTDRHGNNYRTAEDGSPMGIDHGLCFGARRSGDSRFVRSLIHHGHTVVQPWLMSLLGKADLDKIETELLTLGVCHEQIDLLAQRLIGLYTKGTIGWGEYGLVRGFMATPTASSTYMGSDSSY